MNRASVRLFMCVAVLTSACGAPKATTATSSAAPRATASPVPSATASTAPNLLFAVLESHPPSQQVGPDTVAIAGLDGYARAKSHFQPVAFPKFGCAPWPPIQAYTAAGKVFYMDGRGVVRSLSPSGDISTVTTFPITESQQEATFAVSPDGRHLMGAVWTFPQLPPQQGPYCGNTAFGSGAVFQQDIYSATAGQPAQHLRHDSWTQPTTSPFLEFIGWDSVGPIGADHATYARQGGGGGPFQWAGDPVRIDPGGRPGAPLLGPACIATDVNQAGFLCVEGQSGQGQTLTFSVRTPDGSETWHFGKADVSDYSLLSPNRREVALLDQVIGAEGTDFQFPKTSDGSLSFVATGWLDDSTLIGWGTTSSEIELLKVVPGAQPQDLGFQGSFVGIVHN